MEENKLTAAYAEELYRSAENWTDIRQQLRNLNYYVGNQWITWNNTLKRIEKLTDERGRTRVAFNKIQPIVTTLISKHIKNKLKFNVVPGSREQQDVDAAKAADKFLDYLWDDLDLSEKTKQMFTYMIVQKRCMVKTWYDAEDGEDISPGPDDGEIFDDWVENGAKPIRKGKIKAKVCDPLTVFYDPSAKSKEEIRWVIERYAKDVDDIKEEYGVDDITPDANIDYLTRFDIANVGTSGTTSRIKNMAVVMELWMKPCSKYPNGAKLTVCNGKEIDYDDNAGELPYELFGYIPVPGTLLYEAVVSNLIEPQKNFNIIRSMIATHAVRMGNSIWKLPTGTIADEGLLTNEEGAIIEYNATMGEPKREPAVELPAFYFNELAQTSQDIDDASGAREISQGALPSGLDTLGGLELMVEQENEKLSISGQEYEQGMEKVLGRILRLVKEKYTEERQVKILGDDNEVELLSFNGSDLTGNEDIKIVQGSSLPEMKAAQQERIATMYKMGAIIKKDGTPDTGKFLRLMGLGNSEELFGQEDLDSNNAKLENRTFQQLSDDEEFMRALLEYEETYNALAQTEMPPEEIEKMLPPLPNVPVVWSSDDHEIHIREHNIERKSGYRNWPEPVRRLLDKHYDDHVRALQEPQMQQHQMQMQQQQQEQEQQLAMKQMDQQNSLEKEQMKAQTQIAVASLRR